MHAGVEGRTARASGLAGPTIALALVASLMACSTSQPSLRPSTGTPTLAPGSTASPANPDLARLAITLEPFTAVEGGPLAMAAPDDGSGRLFVATQEGRIWTLEADGTVPTAPLVDLGSRIRSGGEQGLLGLALHPTFPTDPRVFVDYTDTNGDTVVASLSVDPGDPDRLDPASHQQLLFVDQPYANHNGGALAFGPDGFLYVSLGDGGAGGDPHDNGQRLDTLLGKILRLDVDGGETYLIPEDNPFASGGGLGEIWLSGLRNPWRMSFDRATGDLWIGDVGQGAWEEVDVARAGAGGLNFGWRVMEGKHCYRAETCRAEGITLPASDYGRDQGCTVIGGYVYRGTASPVARGTYLFGDACSGNLFAIDPGTTGYQTPVIVGTGARGIASFGEDAAGELYALVLDGTISKVVASRR